MTDVVYIDDESALLRALKLVLENFEFSVATFEDADEALDYIDENVVGVVLCDYRMPRKNGLEVLRAMDKTIPFFLISGDIQIEREVQSEPGLTGFLGKPLSMIGIATLVKETLNPTA